MQKIYINKIPTFTLAEVFLHTLTGQHKNAFTLAEVFSTLFAGQRKCAFTLAEVFFTLFAGQRKCAFTLAEVLITLGIIGVVAAMTLPAFIQSYKRHETAAKLKKFNSIFNQMMLLAENEEGSSKDWTRNGDIVDESGHLDWDANFAEQRRFFEKYFAKYINYLKIEDGETETSEDGTVSVKHHTRIFLKDGSIIYFYNGGAFDFIYDTNGDKKPNEMGYDRFNWEVWPSTALWAKYYPKNQNYGTRRYIFDAGTKTRNEYIVFCKNAPVYCARLLELDNWEFKNDYPYKL